MYILLEMYIAVTISNSHGYMGYEGSGMREHRHLLRGREHHWCEQKKRGLGEA